MDNKHQWNLDGLSTGDFQVSGGSPLRPQDQQTQDSRIFIGTCFGCVGTCVIGICFNFCSGCGGCFGCGGCGGRCGGCAHRCGGCGGRCGGCGGRCGGH